MQRSEASTRRDKEAAAERAARRGLLQGQGGGAIDSPPFLAAPHDDDDDHLHGAHAEEEDHAAPLTMPHADPLRVTVSPLTDDRGGGGGGGTGGGDDGAAPREGSFVGERLSNMEVMPRRNDVAQKDSLP